MAKLGRYSAQRRKVEAIDAGASKTVEVADCGTLFAVDGADDVTVTMPSIAAAGNGWWCEFLLKTAVGGGKSVVINLNAADATDDALLIEGADSGGTVSISDSDLTLAATCPAGTRVVYQLADGKFFIDSTA